MSKLSVRRIARRLRQALRFRLKNELGAQHFRAARRAAQVLRGAAQEDLEQLLRGYASERSSEALYSDLERLRLQADYVEPQEGLRLLRRWQRERRVHAARLRSQPPRGPWLDPFDVPELA